MTSPEPLALAPPEPRLAPAPSRAGEASGGGFAAVAGRGARDAAPSRSGSTRRRAVAENLESTGEGSDHEDMRNVRAFLAGDASGFEALFDKYREKVYGIAYRFVRNKEDALEVTQEVFLRVHLGLKRFKTNSRFFTWLYRITVNRAIDFARSRKTQPLIGLDAAAFEAGAAPGRGPAPAGPAEAAEERELEEKLQEAIAALSPKHRAVFVLHASEDLSYRQIADVLGCNIGTVMSRLFYARRKLAEFLAARGIDVLRTTP